MEAVLGAALPGEPARALGWARYRVADEHYPGLVTCAGAVTWGTLYSTLDPADFAVLDDFEGDLYDRVELEVEPSGTAPRFASAYVIPTDRVGRLTREPWSLEAFRAAHLEVFLLQCREFRRVWVKPNT